MYSNRWNTICFQIIYSSLLQERSLVELSVSVSIPLLLRVRTVLKIKKKNNLNRRKCSKNWTKPIKYLVSQKYLYNLIWSHPIAVYAFKWFLFLQVDYGHLKTNNYGTIWITHWLYLNVYRRPRNDYKMTIKCVENDFCSIVDWIKKTTQKHYGNCAET